MAADCKDSVRCRLDENGCLRLSSILRAFNASISEEQAWAVCFQSAKCMVKEWASNANVCYCLTDSSHVFIHKDGSVHGSTVRLPVIGDVKRELALSQHTLVANLGMILFHALDYGLCHNQERKLSPPLECLIDRMTSANASYCSQDGDKAGLSSDDEDSISNSLNADEGIEQDSGEDDRDDMPIYSDTDDNGKHRQGMTLVKVMEMCASHLACPGQADSHYKAVCRALVAEILDLSTFLENVSNENKMLLYEDEAGTLAKLNIQDWAKLWMQVIQQLRYGVKLKKVDPAQVAHPIEFELTPYEMLLDDIRSRRYKLRQVMVNGDIPPRVKKDAHALILEFIRSRPPLVPVSKRKLPPTPPRQLSLYEKLMVSIRQQHKLKPTSTNVETSRTKLRETDVTPQPHRRLIKADLSLRLSSSFEDDDLDDIPQTPAEQQQLASVPLRNGKASIVRSNSHIGASTAESDRRHSITVCESPPKLTNGTCVRNLDRTTRSDYWKSSQWQSLECLSLTLEEVVHIRSVLTKADLETLIVDPGLYEDVLKGKVCFTCKYTRFSFFGPWATKCKMCERAVCDKCCSKMRIPTEHFARIPVYMLTPSPSPPPEEEPASQSNWRFSNVFSFSSQSPPDELPTHQDTTKKKTVFSHSESLHAIPNGKSKDVGGPAPPKRKKTPLIRAKTIQESASIKNNDGISDKCKGPLLPVCRDCKVMVCNIISASNKKLPDREAKKNWKTWPRKKSTASPVLMSPVEETPPPSPDEGFNSMQTHANAS